MIAQRLTSILEKLPSGVRLVAVSKFHPVERLMEAYDAGQRIFGESRPQELAVKVPQMPSDVEWHFIGHLQTNKLKLVLPYATLVHSVDSQHLLQAVSDWGVRNGKVVNILLELHLGSEETKHGLEEGEIRAIVSAAEQYPGVCIRGLMGMATNTDDVGVIAEEFRRIGLLFDDIKSSGILPQFDELSIGMSDDWPLALKNGATLVRIGTAIFGAREY